MQPLSSTLQNWRAIITWMSHDINWLSRLPQIVTWLSHDSHDCHMTVTWLSHDLHDYHMTVTWLSHDCHMVTLAYWCCFPVHEFVINTQVAKKDSRKSPWIRPNLIRGCTFPLGIKHINLDNCSSGVTLKLFTAMDCLPKGVMIVAEWLCFCRWRREKSQHQSLQSEDWVGICS